MAAFVASDAGWLASGCGGGWRFDAAVRGIHRFFTMNYLCVPAIRRADAGNCIRRTLPVQADTSVRTAAAVAGIQTCRQGRAGKELKVAAVETTNIIVAIVIL